MFLLLKDPSDLTRRRHSTQQKRAGGGGVTYLEILSPSDPFPSPQAEIRVLQCRLQEQTTFCIFSSTGSFCWVAAGAEVGEQMNSPTLPALPTTHSLIKSLWSGRDSSFSEVVAKAKKPPMVKEGENQSPFSSRDQQNRRCLSCYL